MSSEFPFAYAKVHGLGVLFYPIVRIELKTIVGWKEFECLVDTGADVTTFPSTIIKLLGINVRSLHRYSIQGVGGISASVWTTTVPIRILGSEIESTSWITADKSTPILLGRKDIFDDKFSLVLDSVRKLTIIKKN